MDEADKGRLMTTIGVRGGMFLLVLAHPGCPRQNPERRKTAVCVCACASILYHFSYSELGLFTKVNNFNLPHLHLAPRSGVTPRNFADIFGTRKQESPVLCDPMFRCVDTIPACNKQKDGQTHDDG